MSNRLYESEIEQIAIDILAQDAAPLEEKPRESPLCFLCQQLNSSLRPSSFVGIILERR